MLHSRTTPAALLLARHIHPGIWAGALLLKKWTVYKAASDYGWPRVHRRLLEQNRVHVPPEHQPAVRKAVGMLIRYPTQIFSTIRDTPHLGPFLRSAAEGVSEGARALPQPVQSLLRAVLASTETGKTFAELNKYAPKGRERGGGGTS